ncbi:thiamine pyrophosphate-binding protein [Cryobacterium sp. PH29-G1]|uniref:thiamine pyrophosphate-binding protein n=1 Tax=Cryobacterium sp. PH29-G1 TaxID=3046211 RepID=UPI0024BB35C4|nr:thiamine pyrophosphate-binding protein [Cryobacterium sp. PH29-G1]MDJ0350252.1 thiamine pyrophosphate-binding protein [Cryobacterium sp. PH29-G1]
MNTAPNNGTVSDIIADVIAEHSEVVFGLMGNGNAFLISSLTARGHRFISARHEQGTVAMADAYHRASGKIATATATYGAGFTNTLTSLAEARLARIPLVLVVGESPTTGMRPWDVDQTAIAGGLGVLTLTVQAHTAAALARRAFEHAARERVPVVVAIPYDLAALPAPAQKNVESLPASPATQTDPDDVAKAASILAQSSRPLIIAGRGAVVSEAGPTLREAGDRLGALFATSVMARNIFGSDWDLGIAGGFGRMAAVEIMRQADVVLVVGAGLNMFQMRYGTLISPDATVIQVDTLPAATHDRVDLFIRSDSKVFGELLLDELEMRTTGWRSRVPEVADGRLAEEPPSEELAPDGRLNPKAFAQALETILPVERTIVQDGGHFSGWIPMYCSAPDPQALMLVGTAFQTIGLGLPAAVGAAQAGNGRTTVLVTGDGGALMALAELETMIRAVNSGIIVVFNDAAYGAELHQYAARGLHSQAMLIDEVDFAAVGRAFGAEALKARSLSDLDQLKDWVARGCPGVFVLDLPVSQTVIAEYMSESMQGILAPVAPPTI